MSQEEYTSIKNWATEDRPREKLLLKGIDSLSNAELLAILIATGSRKESAVELAKKIFAKFDNSLNLLGKCTVDDLTEIKGIGQAKAITILSAMELGRRRKISDVMEKKVIRSSMDTFHLFGSLLGDLPHEEFWVLLLSRSNKIIEKFRVSQGGVSATVTDTRIIIKQAILKLASGIILCHNHPSGNMQPSQSDIELTKKVKEACKLLDILVLDHVIVSEKSFYSFADEGRI